MPPVRVFQRQQKANLYLFSFFVLFAALRMLKIKECGIMATKLEHIVNAYVLQIVSQ